MLSSKVISAILKASSVHKSLFSVISGSYERKRNPKWKNRFLKNIIWHTYYGKTIPIKEGNILTG